MVKCTWWGPTWVWFPAPKWWLTPCRAPVWRDLMSSSDRLRTPPGVHMVNTHSSNLNIHTHKINKSEEKCYVKAVQNQESCVLGFWIFHIVIKVKLCGQISECGIWVFPVHPFTAVSARLVNVCHTGVTVVCAWESEGGSYEPRLSRPSWWGSLSHLCHAITCKLHGLGDSRWLFCLHLPSCPGVTVIPFFQLSRCTTGWFLTSSLFLYSTEWWLFFPNNHPVSFHERFSNV